MAVASPRAAFLSRAGPEIPVDWHDEAEHRRLLAEGLVEVKEGKLRSVGTVTLAASVATTVVQDRRVGATSEVFLSAKTPTAGGEMGVWISAIGTLSSDIPSFTINHAVDSRVDRTFGYLIVG